MEDSIDIIAIIGHANPIGLLNNLAVLSKNNDSDSNIIRKGLWPIFIDETVTSERF